MTERFLQIVVCGAGPAADVTRLISIARGGGWSATIIATAAALDFIDTKRVEALSGHPVRTAYRATGPGTRALPSVDALIIAPATFNTVNKLAAGIADTYPLTAIAELIGRRVPTVVVPFVNSALASRAPFVRALAALRDEGIEVLVDPHPPGTGADKQSTFPWQAAFDVAARANRR